MTQLRKLPDAEFALMRIVWDNPAPISTNQILACLTDGARRKPQTVLTLLTRLMERGFLRAERVGKERIYYPLIDRETYIAFESGEFLEKFHRNSFLNLVHTLYQGQQVTDADLDELRRWLDEKG